MICERIVLVFQFPVYINTIWEQAHADAGLGVLSMERSLRARGGSGSVWRWLVDQVIIMIMIWKHDHESASGAGMNSATLDKTEIKKRLKKRHHADSQVRFFFSDQYVLKSKIHILYIKSVFSMKYEEWDNEAGSGHCAEVSGWALKSGGRGGGEGQNLIVLIKEIFLCTTPEI